MNNQEIISLSETDLFMNYMMMAHPVLMWLISVLILLFIVQIISTFWAILEFPKKLNRCLDSITKKNNRSRYYE